MNSKKVIKKPAAKTVVKKVKAEPKLPRIRMLSATGKNRLEKKAKPTKKSRRA